MRAAIGLIFVAMCCASCVTYRLEHRLVQQVEKGRLHEDLAVIALNNPGLACPKYFQGDNSGECPPGTSLSAGQGYDPLLPDMALFSVFFLQHQYDTVKDIIEDPWLTQTLAKVPDPSQTTLDWYRDYRSTFSTPIISVDEAREKKIQWTPVQVKLLRVFHNIQSWNFCPSTRTTTRGTVHAVYKDRQITLYKTACNAGTIYGAKVKTLARSYRFYFIGAHELGHAIDYEAGQLDNSTIAANTESEKRANMSGLIIAKAVARLMYKMILMYEHGMQTSPQYVPKKYDQAFINRLKAKGVRVEKYFDNLIKDAQKDVNRGDKKKLKLDESWTSNFCLEY